MKSVIIITLLALFSLSAQPSTITYQGVLKDDNGDVITGTESIKFDIYTVETGGSSLWTETHITVAVSNGLFNVELGSVTPFGSLDFSQELWLEITVSGNTLSPRIAFNASGYAMAANETDPLFTTWDKSTGISITESQISDFGNYIETESDPRIPTGTQAGQMQYWDGTEWVTVDAGESGQTLYFFDNKPQWGPVIGANDVYNPTTGAIWMDRNLGATQVATSSTDADSYGNLYQWGRAADGHESRTSNTTITLATSDTPGHGDFIINGIHSPYDWRNPQNDNLWQVVSGINNPCPSGYRLPTEAEWESEIASWGSNNVAGAFASLLELPAAGRRSYWDGSIEFVGSVGGYWSSTVDGVHSRYLYFGYYIARMSNFRRAGGFSVRCIKD
jgi:uncharacterized protein (TIGR02145 family)